MGHATSSGRTADSVLGNNDRVPTRDEITSGTATYGGLPVRLNVDMSADAHNLDSLIEVSNKFFDHPADIQRYILNHEVAHNWADDLMAQNSGRWQQFTSAFITEKQVPPSSSAYARGQRTYWEGLYGDIGATAASETVTRAMTEYLDNPARLKSRSRAAYNEIRRYVRSRG